MHYEINISLNGQHFFATAPRSIQSEFELREVYPILSNKFPEKEGYEISVYRFEESSHEIKPFSKK